MRPSDKSKITTDLWNLLNKMLRKNINHINLEQHVNYVGEQKMMRKYLKSLSLRLEQTSAWLGQKNQRMFGFQANP